MAKAKRSQETGEITPISLADYSKDAMSTYGTYVLMDRAVADARDGLKPVQRRILWAMYELYKQFGNGFKKSAKIVGDAMGNYHPHGNTAIYQTMVNMVWARYPLVEGYGNYGGPTDNAAADRYTEARLTPFAQHVFKDIDVAQMVKNYSGDRDEPLVLPSRIPLLLLNGSEGIGVGLRASIPPHNLRELIRALAYYMRKESPTVRGAMKHLLGPDYAQGLITSTPEEIHALYETGQGTLKYRCDYALETDDAGRQLLVLKSLAPGFSLERFLEKMKDLSDNGLIDYCSDTSAGNQIRVLVAFRDGVVFRDRILPELNTSQAYSFYVVRRADDSSLSSETLFSGGLFKLFQEFLDFRRDVERKRLKREMTLAKARLLKAKAILAAILNLDAVTDVLKNSRKYESTDQMRAALAEKLGISETQANVILEMKVQQLARRNEQGQRSEIESIEAEIQQIEADLQDVDGVILKHLKEIVAFSDERKMQFADAAPASIEIEETEKWVIAQGSKVSRLAGEVDRRNKFDFVTRARSSVTVVYVNNNAESLQTSYFSEHQGPKDIVGLVGDGSTILVAVDDTGKIVTLEHPPSKTSYNVMRGATQLTSAAGLSAGDSLLLLTDENTGTLLKYESLKGTRTFVKGMKVFPTREMDSDATVVRAVRVPAQGGVYAADGSKLRGTFEAEGVFVLGQRNFVLVKGGKKDILDLSASRTLLKNGELEAAWPLD
jgi:DNA gyrase/topoisomerase IV subunit A